MRYPKLSLKNCSNCGKEFQPKNSLTKFCSLDCHYKQRDTKGAIKKCKICKKEFYVYQSRFGQNLCSKECAHKSLEKRKQLKCKQCGKLYERTIAHLQYKGSKFCSRTCKGLSQRRKNTEKFGKGKRSFKKVLWKFFSLYIRQRDKGVCISCGKTDDWRNTDAGHYIPKTAGLSIYFDEQNVNCQCVGCNRFRHGNLSQYAIALRKKYGPDILEELDKRRATAKVFTIDEYRNLIDHYKKLVESYAQ